jgi:hypothetical protein
VRRPRVAGRAPLAVAAFLSVPLFFSSLLAFSLALERTHRAHGTLEGTTSTVEAKIWAIALLPSLAVIAVGAIAMLSRYGLYASAAAAIAAALIVTAPLGTWAKRHTARFPLGEDLIPANDPSDHLDRGQWEGQAKDAALSLAHWTIALAAAAALIALVVEIRRRRRPIAPPPLPPPPVVEGEAQTSVTRI